MPNSPLEMIAGNWEMIKRINNGGPEHHDLSIGPDSVKLDQTPCTYSWKDNVLTFTCNNVMYTTTNIVLNPSPIMTGDWEDLGTHETNTWSATKQP